MTAKQRDKSYQNIWRGGGGVTGRKMRELFYAIEKKTIVLPTLVHFTFYRFLEDTTQAATPMPDSIGAVKLSF